MKRMTFAIVGLALILAESSCSILDGDEDVHKIEVMVGLTVCSAADSSACAVMGVPNVTVSIEQAQQEIASGKTDERGQVELEVSSTGRVTVRAHANPFGQQILETMMVSPPDEVISVSLVNPEPVQVQPLVSRS